MLGKQKANMDILFLTKQMVQITQWRRNDSSDSAPLPMSDGYGKAATKLVAILLSSSASMAKKGRCGRHMHINFPHKSISV